MTPELFADTVGRVDFSGGIIRIELGSVEPVEGTPKGTLAVRQRVIMPVEGFLTALATLNDLANKLVAAGVIRRNEATPGAEKP